jgi:hypothetical protein
MSLSLSCDNDREKPYGRAAASVNRDNLRRADSPVEDRVAGCYVDRSGAAAMALRMRATGGHARELAMDVRAYNPTLLEPGMAFSIEPHVEAPGSE